MAPKNWDDTIGVENVTCKNGFDFSDVVHCADPKQKTVRFQCCNGLHHVFITLDLQGQNCCIKQIPGNFPDVMYCIVLHQFNSHQFSWCFWIFSPMTLSGFTLLGFPSSLLFPKKPNYFLFCFFFSTFLKNLDGRNHQSPIASVQRTLSSFKTFQSNLVLQTCHPNLTGGSFRSQRKLSKVQPT